MIKTGLVSVTFRKKTPDEIIAISKKAGLDAIEWGSDVHVPAGDTILAKSIYEKTVEAGLEIASYGSYYRLGEGDDFNKYLQSAIELHAPNIRVWAGRIPSADATESDWQKAIDDAESISNAAARHNITVSLEYHANTLTDTVDSTLRLLSSVRASNFHTYWQPPLTVAPNEQLPELLKLLKSEKVTNLHVYQRNSAGEKVPLEVGASAWREYIKAANRDGKTRCALLEFVVDDDDAVFLEDSRILNKLCGKDSE